MVVFVPIIFLGPVQYFISTILSIALGQQFHSLVWVLLQVYFKQGGVAFINGGKYIIATLGFLAN